MVRRQVNFILALKCGICPDPMRVRPLWHGTCYCTDSVIAKASWQSDGSTPQRGSGKQHGSDGPETHKRDWPTKKDPMRIDVVPLGRQGMPTGTIGRTSGAGREDGAGEASSGAERHYWLVPIDSELRQ